MFPKSIARFLRSEDGPTAVEYAFMLAMVLMVCIGAIQVISSWVQGSFEDSADEIGNYMT